MKDRPIANVKTSEARTTAVQQKAHRHSRALVMPLAELRAAVARCVD